MFYKHIDNPIYGTPETGTLFDVYLTKQTGNRFRMDFSWITNDTTAVSFSDDGVHWSPPQSTLTPDPTSGWEERINRNCVLKIGDVYKMWYTGQADDHSYIGYAESADGLTFHRVRREPILVPESPWEGSSVMNPCVLFENDTYRMWYSAGETYEPNVLAYAESADGIHWKKTPINPVFVNEPRNEFEQERIGGCQMIPNKELGYLLFYIGYRDIHTACICCTYSRDGITQFHRCKMNPLIPPTEDAWDADSCYKPSALFDPEQNEWRIWYNGRRGNEEYIGLAIQSGDFSVHDFE